MPHFPGLRCYCTLLNMGPELPFLCIPPPESQVSLRPPLLDQTAAVLRPALESQAGYYLLLPRPNCRCFVIYFIGLNMTLVSHHQGHVVIPLLPLGTELGLDPLPPRLCFYCPLPLGSSCDSILSPQNLYYCCICLPLPQSHSCHCSESKRSRT